MKNLENDTTQQKPGGDDTTADTKQESPAADQNTKPTSNGFLDRVHNMFRFVPQAPSPSIRNGSRDRTRSLVLLIGGSVGALLLFIGVFSTPPRPTLQETRNQAAPNLGRPSASAQVQPPQGSVTPLLTADVRSTDSIRDQVTPSDISGTSRRSSDEREDEVAIPPVARRRASSYRTPAKAPPVVEPGVTPGPLAEDPLAAYRLNNAASASTYQYGSTAPSDLGTRSPGTFSYGGSITASQSGQRTPTPTRSSIVFVRDAKLASSPAAQQTAPSLSSVDAETLLPPGTRLIARMDAAATSALQTPVVASIEYNYERDGAIAIPAGSKVIGEVRQASTDGYVDVRFHTLQMPNGRDVSIDATATSLDLRPLRGAVSGKNTGKRILSRTLSGVGTIAAYVVGGGGGLSSAVTGETLLRDRVAGNIALAGEEQLRNAAYTQNITVTLPANMRFYVVLQKGTVSVSPPVSSVTDVPVSRTPAELPTVQEIRELMDLRREINRMYQESNGGPGGPPQ